MAGLHLTSSNERAARSLQRQLTISRSKPRVDNSTTYYTVRLTIGKGNWYCQFLKWQHIPVRLVVSSSIRWKPTDNPESIGFHSYAYPIMAGGRVSEGNLNFYLVPNTAIELAVAKREHFNTYTLHGFLPTVPLSGSYNLHLRLVNQDNEELPELIIDNYLINGMCLDEETP